MGGWAGLGRPELPATGQRRRPGRLEPAGGRGRGCGVGLVEGQGQGQGADGERQLREKGGGPE